MDSFFCECTLYCIEISTFVYLFSICSICVAFEGCNITLQEDKTVGSFYLCHLVHVLSVITKSICTRVCLHTIIICTDNMAVYMCPCMLLVIAGVLQYWLYVP